MSPVFRSRPDGGVNGDDLKRHHRDGPGVGKGSINKWSRANWGGIFWIPLLL